MATTTKSRKSTEKELHLIGRCQFKSVTGATLYAVQDSEKVYHVTMHEGRVTGCTHADGERCRSFFYRGYCSHTRFVEAYEGEYGAMVSEQVAEDAVVAPAILGEQFAQDIDQHVQDSIESGELDEIERERLAWAVMSPEEKRARMHEVFDLSYGDAA